MVRTEEDYPRQHPPYQNYGIGDQSGIDGRKLHMSVRSYSYLESGVSCCSARTLVLYLLYYCPDVSEFLSELRAAFEKVDEAA